MATTDQDLLSAVSSMAVADSDLLKKLPAELRLDIYRLVLISDVKLGRHTHEFQSRGRGEKCPSGCKSCMPARNFMIGSLLSVSQYIHDEAADILYGENTFELSLPDVTNFSSSADFCKIKCVFLVHDGAEFRSSEVALEFGQTADLHAQCTHDKKLALHTVVLTGNNLRQALPFAQAPKYVPAQAKAKVTQVDFGLWSFHAGQPYTIQIEDLSLRKAWATIQQNQVTTEASSGVHMMYKQIAKMRNTELYTRRLKIALGSNTVVTTLHAIALDAVRGVGFTDARWLGPPHLMPPWPLHYTEPLRLHERIVADGNAAGSQRLIDVDAQCSEDVLAWANEVLLAARINICR
ncbi:Glycosylphosphatidylinositol (GPI) anchor assembly protein [Elasticomyces elasticus]|uniref:Glycosylphosphatidylinositol (GPI) anchor assembly protein n=1 Tax=Elasticomyces elasticus TaxID=574655 RepID=A0AAN7VWY4_9PEZI|nr:Glycosylphosphatidylinositol (GPI) anchor assembly protein [Elasticomyces elasticus]